MFNLLPPSRRSAGYALIVALLFVARPTSAQTATDLTIHTTSASFKVGADATYTITVSNVGAATDADIHVTTTLPDGLSLSSTRGIDWSCSAVDRQVDCVTHSSVGDGGNTSFSLVVSVCTAAFPNVTTTFEVVYPADTNTANNAATRTTAVRAGQCGVPTATRTATPGPARTATAAPTSTRTPFPNATDLSLLKTSSGAFMVGTNGVYTLLVSNVGLASANTPITVVDALPDGLGFVSAIGFGWTCGLAGQVVTCTNPGPLAAGSSTSIRLTVSVGRAASPTVTNTATLSYPGDTNPSNNTARKPTTVRLSFRTPLATGTLAPTPTPSPTALPTFGNAAATDLLLSKTIGGLFILGRNGAYSLTVSNLGAVSTNAPIRVTDSLPNGLSFVSGGGTGWSCSNSGQVVTCTRSTAIAPGGSGNIILTVSVGNAAFPSVTNVASVSYPGDTNAGNNIARRPTTIRAAAHSTPATRASLLHPRVRRVSRAPH